MWKNLFRFAPPGDEEGGESDFLDDLDATLNDEGDQGDDEHQEDGEGTEGKETQPTPEWRQAFDQLRSENEDRTLQIMATLSQIMQGREGKETSAPAPVDSDEAMEKAWKLAQEMPDLLPQLVKETSSRSVKGEKESLKKEILAHLDRRQFDETLGGVITSNYSEDLKDRASEILAETPRLKKMLEGVLDPSVRGTPLHDKMALIMAAGAKPEAVTKRMSAKIKAAEEARQARLNRLSQFGIGGRGKPTEPKEPTITDADRDLAERYKINLEDPKVRERLLRYKQTERLTGIRGLGE